MEILLLLVCSKLGGKKYINTDTDTQVRTHTVTQKTRTNTQATLKTHPYPCEEMIVNASVVLKGGNTIAHPQAHTSWYSRHLCHILESVGRHRRDTHKRKTQCTTFRGAGACAHERRTGVVAAEGAAAKGHCPWYGRARDGASVLIG